jgi:hypothetical protein
MPLKGVKMDTIYIAVIALLAGVGGTLGVQHALRPQDTDDTVEVLKAIKELESSIDKAEASAIIALTEVDLLKIPCSEEYIEKHGESLCREMFCRMNRQGQAQGSTAKECDAISNTINSQASLKTCMVYWDDKTRTSRGLDQNSRYAQCLNLFEKRK